MIKRIIINSNYICRNINSIAIIILMCATLTPLFSENLNLLLTKGTPATKIEENGEYLFSYLFEGTTIQIDENDWEIYSNSNEVTVSYRGLQYIVNPEFFFNPNDWESTGSFTARVNENTDLFTVKFNPFTGNTITLIDNVIPGTEMMLFTTIKEDSGFYQLIYTREGQIGWINLNNTIFDNLSYYQNTPNNALQEYDILEENEIIENDTNIRRNGPLLEIPDFNLNLIDKYDSLRYRIYSITNEYIIYMEYMNYYKKYIINGLDSQYIIALSDIPIFNEDKSLLFTLVNTYYDNDNFLISIFDISDKTNIQKIHQMKIKLLPGQNIRDYYWIDQNKIMLEVSQMNNISYLEFSRDYNWMNQNHNFDIFQYIN